ncbi:MAG: DedA family protein [Elusimicrobia bacterium]|nr:DedA family protein [Chloroflexia bacterium]TXH25870.1 MAG: DedA family protein [Elusimicrobiota bacterium]
MFDWLATWVTNVIETLGYPGLTILVALENLFPPIPSEVILPLAGFLTGQGRFSFALVLISSTLGSLIGALVLYAIGVGLGRGGIRRLFEKYGYLALLTPEDLTRAEDWFDRWGPVAVFTGRLVPVVRSLVSIPAGYRRMPLVQFIPLTVFGSLLWNGALVSLGWAFGENWHAIEKYVGWLQYVVIAVVALLLIRFVWSRLRQRRAV